MLILSQTWSRQVGQVLRERLGVGLAQLKIMNLLHAEPGASQRHLADSLAQTEASISRQIKLMQDYGWLQTIVDPNERRKRRAKLTPAGLKLTIAAQEVISEQNRIFCQKLTEKQQVLLLKLLKTL